MYAELSVDGNHTRVGGLDAKTIVEIHQMLRRTLDDAVRRGLIVANPVALALSPRRRPRQQCRQGWNAYKVVSERLGHSTPAFPMATYQHILPGMQREAAETFASLLELLPDSTR